MLIQCSGWFCTSHCRFLPCCSLAFCSPVHVLLKPFSPTSLAAHPLPATAPFKEIRKFFSLPYRTTQLLSPFSQVRASGLPGMSSSLRRLSEHTASDLVPSTEGTQASVVGTHPPQKAVVLCAWQVCVLLCSLDHTFAYSSVFSGSGIGIFKITP